MQSGALDKLIPYPAISSTFLWREWHIGTIFYKSVIPLTYADAVDIIIDGIDREVVVAFFKFVMEARSIGLAVNESKTKCLLSTAKDTSIGLSVDIDGYNLEFVKDFVYLGSRINTDNDISLEIYSFANASSLCYSFSFNAQTK